MKDEARMSNNEVYLYGVVEEAPKFAYESNGEKFYDCMLKVDRLSGVADVLPVTIAGKFKPEQIHKDEHIYLRGEFRSFNKLENERSRLYLTVFVRELLDSAVPPKNPNQISLYGYICKAPTYRITPFNREITDVLLAVNRAYNKSDYIPCIAWGRNAEFTGHLSVGTQVELKGRIQSRQYKKKTESGEEIRTAYEVSISFISANYKD